MTALVIQQCGPGVSVQDGGRFGWQRYGVGVSGAMDRFALAMANALVSNPPDASALEFTLLGGSFEVEHGSARIAVAGAAALLSIDGERVAPLTSVTVEAGQRIMLGAATTGVFFYLAVSGGILVTPVLGSRSFHLRGGLGGLDGRPLARGFRLALADRPSGSGELCGEMLPDGDDPDIRVMMGPQADYFSAHGLKTFLGNDYTISNQADRMGFRLSGPVIEHGPDGFNIVSDGIVTGSVQVPGAGEPIVLMADRQTTGGYPKIATVISADLPRLAQKRPGASIRFAPVDRGEAIAALKERLSALDRFRANLQPPGAFDLDSARLLSLNLVDGVVDAIDP